MSVPSYRILASLSKEGREKLAQCLKEADYHDLLGVPGIGEKTLRRLLPSPGAGGPHWLCWDSEGNLFDYNDPFQYIPWFTFTVYPDGNIYYRVEGLTPLRKLSGVFHKDAMLALLKHFEITIEHDVNAHLEELREIKTRLELFRCMENPVIEDYLRDLLYQLRYDS